jgi:hypothetical protein
MDTEHVSKTMQMVQSQIAELEQQLCAKRRMANGLCELIGLPPAYPDTEPTANVSFAIRGDEYYGRPLATVVKDILQKRAAASLGAISLDELYETMLRGSFKFDAKNDGTARRSLAISIAKNPAFHKVPNGSIGLAAWYPEAKGKTNGGKAEARAEADDDDFPHEEFAEEGSEGDSNVPVSKVEKTK